MRLRLLFGLGKKSSSQCGLLLVISLLVPLTGSVKNYSLLHVWEVRESATDTLLPSAEAYSDEVMKLSGSFNIFWQHFCLKENVRFGRT